MAAIAGLNLTFTIAPSRRECVEEAFRRSNLEFSVDEAGNFTMPPFDYHTIVCETDEYHLFTILEDAGFHAFILSEGTQAHSLTLRINIHHSQLLFSPIPKDWDEIAKAKGFQVGDFQPAPEEKERMVSLLNSRQCASQFHLRFSTRDPIGVDSLLRHLETLGIDAQQSGDPVDTTAEAYGVTMFLPGLMNDNHIVMDAYNISGGRGFASRIMTEANATAINAKLVENGFESSIEGLIVQWKLRFPILQ